LPTTPDHPSFLIAAGPSPREADNLYPQNQNRYYFFWKQESNTVSQRYQRLNQAPCYRRRSPAHPT
jgi:hypothetical protein